MEEKDREVILLVFNQALSTLELYIEQGYRPHLCLIIKDLNNLGKEVAIKYLHNNFPTATLHTQFYKHYSFISTMRHNKDVGAWWTGSEGNQQRVLFLKHLIKQLEDGKEL